MAEMTSKEKSLKETIETNKRQHSNQLSEEESRWKKRLEEKEYEL